MATLHRHTFTVEGLGQFPYDMLRYDRCYPASENDSYRMVDLANRRGEHSAKLLTPRRVELVHVDGSARWAPMSVRWESFGWTVLCPWRYAF